MKIPFRFRPNLAASPAAGVQPLPPANASGLKAENDSFPAITSDLFLSAKRSSRKPA